MPVLLLCLDVVWYMLTPRTLAIDLTGSDGSTTYLVTVIRLSLTNSLKSMFLRAFP